MAANRRKTAFVTGATGGIGQAVSRRLAREGYDLQLHYGSQVEKAQHIQQELEQEKLSVQLYQADLRSKQDVQTLANRLQPTPDIFVYAAGTSYYGLVTEVSEEEYAEAIQVHLTAPFLLSQHLLPGMISRGWGRMIFLTSIWGESGASCETLYSMVKGGLQTFTKALAKEVAPAGITVNAVSPGAIDTPMMTGFSREEMNQLQAEIPAGRFGEADEIAHAVSFLADEQSGYMTGQVVRVNGGWYV